ncbi:hypothetical protein C8R43DRAFT_1039448 [Mycena crocata]|nr:hypothetical protein C8R43DRAFT_1039448 [Mycena crocata]
MDVDSTSNEPQPVEELWFEDGNLVIQAGNSQFRVYRGFLAARSPVFKDMLSFPQPSDAELIEGCPLVRLPDPALEVTVFLKAIFLSDFFRSFPAKTDFDTVVGCLRLSHKYGVEYLRRRALIHLSSGHRTTLSDWDETDYEVGKGDLSYDLPSWPWSCDPISSLYVVQLFREVDALWLLPVAFFRLSCDSERLGKRIFHGALYNGAPVHLSEQDQDTFLKGRSIQSHSIWHTLRFLTHPLTINGCTSSARCLTERLRVLNEFQEVIPDHFSDPLEIWAEQDWYRFDHDEICLTCLQELKSTHAMARQEFWDKLPEIYELPPWEALEEQRMAAIGTGWIR